VLFGSTSDEGIVAFGSPADNVLTAGGVNSRAGGCDALSLPRQQHDAEDDADDSGGHQDVADKLQVEPRDLDVQREREDRADDE
jgi:hypothetical protein